MRMIRLDKEEFGTPLRNKIIFPKDNEFLFGQDFSWRVGIPSEIEFTIREIDMDDKIKLTAYGYGLLNSKKPDGTYDHSAYGNGSIYIYRKKEFKSWPTTEEEFFECLVTGEKK